MPPAVARGRGIRRAAIARSSDFGFNGFVLKRSAQVTIGLRFVDVDSNHFSPDLLHRVRDSIERGGICIFGVDEMARLLSQVKGSLASKARALQEFARLCGVEVETTPHLKSAVFLKPSRETHD